VADNQQLAKLAVDDCREVVAWFQPVRVSKRLVDQHFVIASGLQVAAGAKDQAVEGRFAGGRYGDEITPGR